MRDDTTTTTYRHHHIHHHSHPSRISYHNPLDLTPLRPPAPARRSRRRVRVEGGSPSKPQQQEQDSFRGPEPELDRLWPSNTNTTAAHSSGVPRHPRSPLSPASGRPPTPQGHRPSTPRATPRRVLERLWPSPTDIPAYAIDHILSQHPVRTAIILLATPLTRHDDGSSAFTACGSPVVIKAVARPSAKARRRNEDHPLKEIAAMQHLLKHKHRHPSIIPLLDCLQDEDFIYLVLPYLPGGDLFARVKATDRKGIPQTEAINYMCQMAEGLLFMKQTCGLAHHDVSLENVMLTNHQQDVAQLIDLGMCLRVPKVAEEEGDEDETDDEDEQSCGVTQEEARVYLTPQRCSGKAAYVAPEVVREEACDPFAADVWSLGVCFYAMLTGRPLYNSPEDKAFKLMARGEARDVITAYEGYGLVLPCLAKDLVCRMLDANPSQRPTLEEVLTHPFLNLQQASSTADEQAPSLAA